MKYKLIAILKTMLTLKKQEEEILKRRTTVWLQENPAGLQ
jgi:hypothetical protein